MIFLVFVEVEVDVEPCPRDTRSLGVARWTWPNRRLLLLLLLPLRTLGVYDDRKAVPKELADRAEAERPTVKAERWEDDDNLDFAAVLRGCSRRCGVAEARRLRCSMCLRADSAALSRALYATPNEGSV